MKVRPAAIVALCLTLLPAAARTVTAGPPQGPVTVTVDFSGDLGTFRNVAAGFLGHIDSEPFRPSAAQLENNLRPYMWRNDSFCDTQRCEDNSIQDRAYQAVTDNGGVFHKVACKRFTRRFSADCQSIDNASPWDESGHGTTWFQDCYDEAVDALSHDRNPQWDVWNEPNGAAIFRDANGNLRGWELAETYRICYEALAAAYATYTPSPELLVGGPSMSGELRTLVGFLFRDGSPGQAYIAASGLSWPGTIQYGDFGFLEYLDQRPGIDLGFVTLHLFLDEWVMDWARWIDILREAIREEMRASDLARLRSLWGEDLSGLPIYVNEMIGGPNKADYRLDPGHTVVAFEQLHEARVDGAAKACWPDPTDGSSSCDNKTLSGLLIPDDDNDPSRRRPIWWAYKYYAELSGREAAVLTEYPRIDGVAAGDDLGQRYRVLLGFTSASRNGDPDLGADRFDRTNVVLTGLPEDCIGANVTTKLIAPSDYTLPFTESDLALHRLSTANIVDGRLIVPVDDLAAGNVLYITLSTADCDTTPVPPPAPANLRPT